TRLRGCVTLYPDERMKGPPMSLEHLLKERILVLDGAMGTMVQQHRLTEADYRGSRFARHPVDLKNNNEALNLVRPELIEEIHAADRGAGADIVETTTFNANRASMADFAMEALVPELNAAAVAIARRAVEKANAADPSRPRFVAGPIGPMTRCSSVVADVN